MAQEEEGGKAGRMEAFRALVEAQDGGEGVVESRKAVAKRFGLTRRQLLRIEAEGLDAGWPPLED
jgi:hypothetical protein